jgi:hypothetical protein
MSDSTIPFQGQTAVLDRPVDVTGLEPDTSGGGRGRVLALGGVLAVVLLGILAYFLLFAGGEDPAVDSTPVKPRSRCPLRRPRRSLRPSSSPRSPATPSAADPFKALISEPEAAAPVAGAPVTGTGTTTTTGATATVHDSPGRPPTRSGQPTRRPRS